MRKATLIFFLLITTSVNAQWEKVNQIYSGAIEKIYFLDNETGFALHSGINFVLKTDNRFDSLYYKQTGESALLIDIIFTDSLNGFLLSPYGWFYRSNDRGETWEKRVFEVDDQDPLHLDMFFSTGKDTLNAIGRRNLIRTTDGGETWNIIADYSDQFEDQENIIGVKMKTNQKGLIASRYAVYRTEDGGKTIDSLSIPFKDVNISSSFFIGETIFLLQGEARTSSNKYLYKSDNLGETWSRFDLEDGRYTSINGISKDTVFITRQDGSLLQTNDGGETWNLSEINTQYGLYDIYFTNDKTGYLLSNYEIFRSEQFKLGTPLEEKPDVPSGTKLNQNYPNPFNPATKISFSLENNEYVEISIYDLLGRKVEILYSGIKSSGKHRITFNAGHLNSGVYLYELKTGDYIERKKMMLIK